MTTVAPLTRRFTDALRYAKDLDDLRVRVSFLQDELEKLPPDEREDLRKMYRARQRALSDA